MRTAGMLCVALALVAQPICAQPPDSIIRLGEPTLVHGPNLTHLAYSPGGNTITSLAAGHVLGAPTCTVCTWQASTGKQLTLVTIDVPSIAGAALSGDGKIIAVAENQTGIGIYDANSGKPLYHINEKLYSDARMGFSPDGAILAVYSSLEGAGPRLYNSATGKSLGKLPATRGFAFHPDGKQVFIAQAGRAIDAVDLKTLKVTRRVYAGLASVPGNGDIAPNRPGVQFTLAISPDAKYAAIASHELPAAWQGEVVDADSGKLVTRPPLFSQSDLAFVFSPDSTVLAYASTTRALAVAMVELPSGKDLPCINPTPLTSLFAYSPDGRSIALASHDGAIAIWDTKLRKRLFPKAGSEIVSAAILPGNKQALTADRGGTLKLWDLATAKPAWSATTGLATIAAMAVDADGARALLTDGNSTLQLWDLVGQKKTAQAAFADATFCTLAFSPDGKRALAANYSGQAAWSLPDLKSLLATGGNPNAPREYAVSIAPSGRLVATIGQGALPTLRDLQTGQTVYTGASPGPYFPWPLSITRRDDLLVCGDSNGVNIIEVASGKPVDQLPVGGAAPQAGFRIGGAVLAMPAFFGGGPSGYRGATLSPDERLAAAFTFNRLSLDVLDVQNRALLATLKHHTMPITWAAWSPDGRCLITGSADYTAVVWKAPNLASAPTLVSPSPAADLIADLGSDDAAKAWRAQLALVRSGASAVRALAGDLKPVPAADAKQAAAFIARLDDPAYAVRQKAYESLVALGSTAAPAVAAALQDKTIADEKRARLQQALAAFSAPSQADLRAIRAIGALERIGGEGAVKALKTLAGGAEGHRVTSAAKAALERLAEAR